jgi:hypothetical protein
VRSSGPAADDARREFGDLISATGHTVDNARLAVARLKRALEDGALQRTPEIDQMLADIDLVLEQDEGQKLGGKSAEAARFITRRLEQLIEAA